jgi:cytochrome c-type biogenesis protein CcsB
MMPDEALAQLSDLGYRTAVAVYALAAALLLAEFAATRDRRPAPARVAPAAAPGLAGLIGPAPRPARPLPERLGRTGVSVLVVGLLLHAGSIAARGASTSRVPWGNRYEFISITCAAAVLAGLATLRGGHRRPVWLLVLAPVLALMYAGGTALYAGAAPVVPALRSYWLAVHVSVVSTATAVLVVSGAASALHLLRSRPPRRGGPLLARLPDAETLDRAAYRAAVFAFPLLTAGVVFGAIWAEAARGRFWGWDPEETASFAAWVLYAAYLSARATAGRGASRQYARESVVVPQVGNARENS